MKNDAPCEPDNHSYIKTGKDGVKMIQGAAALQVKGIDKGTSTSVDKNGVGGTWKNS